jgi:hypothetical protein
MEFPRNTQKHCQSHYATPLCDCGEETTEHYILHCHIYDHERAKLAVQLKTIDESLDLLHLLTRDSNIDSFAASFASWSAISFSAILAWPGIQDKVVRIPYLINVPIFFLMSAQRSPLQMAHVRVTLDHVDLEQCYIQVTTKESASRDR